jgi:hypothetical protein
MLRFIRLAFLGGGLLLCACVAQPALTVEPRAALSPSSRAPKTPPLPATTTNETATPSPTPLLSPSPTQPPSPTSAVTRTPKPILDQSLNVIGGEEVVFNWKTDRCSAANIPDLPSRAFRDSKGRVQLLLSHVETYRMLGADLSHLQVDCNAVMSSEHNPDPALFGDNEWIAAPYTEDGTTVYAIVHDEYHGYEHPGQCPQQSYFPCWFNALTLSVSTDGGGHYHHAAIPPGHLVADLPFPYEAGAGPYGIFDPSNIVQAKDGYYYDLIKVVFYRTAKQWVCLMRTPNLAGPASWRFWDGSGFNGHFANPYATRISSPNDFVCHPIDPGNIGAQLVESITFNTFLHLYVIVGISADSLKGREVWGFYYSFSEDLIHWTHRKLLMEMALPWTVRRDTDVSYLYPALIDPRSESRNFETTGKTAYLYYTRNNFGQGSLDRDLLRVPVEFFPSE